MGQPSTQASNAIIYLTYGAFLWVFSPLEHNPTNFQQIVWLLHRLAFATSDKERIFVCQSDTDWSGYTFATTKRMIRRHISFPRTQSDLLTFFLQSSLPIGAELYSEW